MALIRRQCLIGTIPALMLSVTGCSEDEDEDTSSPSERVHAWLDAHESTEQEAVEQFNNGNGTFEAERYSQAIMYFEQATETYETLEEAAKDEAREYEKETETWELFSLLGQHYYMMREASTWRYSAAYEIQMNDVIGEPPRRRLSGVSSGLRGLRNSNGGSVNSSSLRSSPSVILLASLSLSLRLARLFGGSRPQVEMRAPRPSTRVTRSSPFEYHVDSRPANDRLLSAMRRRDRYLRCAYRVRVGRRAGGVRRVSRVSRRCQPD